MKRIALVAAACCLAAGCVVVRPSDAQLLDQQAGNAAAINAKIQADPTISADLKTWWAADAIAWKNTADWANGRAPGTPGTPAANSNTTP